ncbi:MAG: CopD family protein, partial [Flavobacterium sp.]|nr:CopD family protein [Flavobacterium sp.]
LWYIITWPSAVLSIIFATWLLILMPAWLQMPWMHVKLGFVALLIAYQIKCQFIYNDLQKDVFKYSSNFMRLWNEGATIILFAVVFLVVLKNAFNWIYGVLGIFLFSILIMLGFKFYKKIRERN